MVSGVPKKVPLVAVLHPCKSRGAFAENRGPSRRLDDVLPYHRRLI